MAFLAQPGASHYQSADIPTLVFWVLDTSELLGQIDKGTSKTVLKCRHGPKSTPLFLM